MDTLLILADEIIKASQKRQPNYKGVFTLDPLRIQARITSQISESAIGSYLKGLEEKGFLKLEGSPGEEEGEGELIYYPYFSLSKVNIPALKYLELSTLDIKPKVEARVLRLISSLLPGILTPPAAITFSECLKTIYEISYLCLFPLDQKGDLLAETMFSALYAVGCLEDGENMLVLLLKDCAQLFNVGGSNEKSMELLNLISTYVKNEEPLISKKQKVYGKNTQLIYKIERGRLMVTYPDGAMVDMSGAQTRGCRILKRTIEVDFVPQGIEELFEATKLSVDRRDGRLKDVATARSAMVQKINNGIKELQRDRKLDGRIVLRTDETKFVLYSRLT